MAMRSLLSKSATSPPFIHSRGKIVILMGATGTGKSSLSIPLSLRFSGEVINSDKIQIYSGLPITTNKIPLSSLHGVPHHLLGSVDPTSSPPVGPTSFSQMALASINSIHSRNNLPIVTGGSTSYIKSLVSYRYRHRYRYCFICIGVDKEVLERYLDHRVEEMVGSGMVEELEAYFRKGEVHLGLGKAIGIEEFGGYFRNLISFEEAVRSVKEKTRRLAEEQVRKIRRLEEEEGWGIRWVDATSAVRARMEGGTGEEAEVAWRRDVVGPAVAAVEEFLEVEFREVLHPVSSCFV